MTNPEKLDSTKSPNSSIGENRFQSDAETFCRIMGRLNAVSLQQTEGLLNVAVRAAEKFHSLNSANNSTGSADLSGFIERMKETGETIREENRKVTEKSSDSIKNGDYEQAIKQAIANAVQNSVACQQQLNVIGMAILSQAAELLLQGKTGE